MKAKFTLLFFVFIAFFSNQSHAQAYQVPNGGFEIWDSVMGQPLYPAGWATYESIFGVQLGLASQDIGLFGNYSIKLYSDTVTGQSSQGIIAGAVSLGTGETVAEVPTFYGMPFVYRPDTLFFAYKYSSPGVDTPFFDIGMTYKDTGLVMAVYGTLPASADWTLEYLTLDSYYASSETPDTLGLQFYSSYNVPVIGSTLNIDQVYFGYKVLPAAIQEVVNKLELSVYPNPTSNVINISTAEDISGYKMLITDMNGRLVDIVTLTGTKSSVDVRTFASGTYIYRIADKGGNIFREDKFIVAR